MQITKNTVVTLHYELSDPEGTVLSASEQAMSYLHGGYGALFESVERALEEQTTGYTADLTLTPAQAYGQIDRHLLRVEPRDRFPEQTRAGLRFQSRNEDGTDTVYTVIAVTEEDVVVDGNHPLAGRTLRFKCRIVDVRAATAEELAAGRALELSPPC